MKRIVSAAIASVAAPVLMLLGATTAQADPDPGVETDRVSVPAPPTADQKLKKEWIRSDGTSVFF